MSSTSLERTRATHEELERLQRLLVSELKETAKTHKESIEQSHRIHNVLTRIIENSSALERIYVDADGSRKDAIAAIGLTGTSLFSHFYDRLREIKEYHRKYPTVAVERPEDLHLPDVDIRFTGQEGFGKYLDLYALFDEYINLKLDGAEKVDYLTYLRQFHVFSKAPAMRLYNKQYKTYTDNLLHYLISFFQRTQPLLDLDKELQSSVKEFDEKWAKGIYHDEVDAPANGALKNSNIGHAPNPSSESDATTKKRNKRHKNKKDKPSELPQNGEGHADASATSHFNDPLYCRACGKLFSKDTVYHAHLSGKRHQQAVVDASSLKKDILLAELKISKLSDMLEEEINATHMHVEHKQSLTLDELMKEQEEEERGENLNLIEEEEDDEPIRMTIKDYPVGWDGKPIPYWLYKLHGLRIEYKCEICGDMSYFGRKAFEKHFQDWRHANGMARLNIPNTRHFQEITKISDAQALWQKIQEDSKKAQWKPDLEMEYEDSDGYVLSKKTYDDLKRQGLLD